MLFSSDDTPAEFPVEAIEVPAAPKSAWDKHNDFQREFIAQMAARIVQGQVIDPKEIEILLIPKYDNSLLRDFAIKNRICTKSGFAEILRRVKISDALGQVPQSASDYVRIIVRRDKMECQYDGMIARDVQPFMICEKRARRLSATRRPCARTQRSSCTPTFTSRRRSTPSSSVLSFV